MQLIEGQTLAQCLAAGPLSPDRLRRFAEQLADALGEAHARGIVTEI